MASRNLTILKETEPEPGLPLPAILVLARLDPIALGFALALVFGLILFLATVVLVLRGGYPIGQNLSLVGQYFVGYSVTWAGAIIGFLYAACFGFLMGYTFAALRNFLVHFYLLQMRRRLQRKSMDDLL
jgi:hypothetical protein